MSLPPAAGDAVEQPAGGVGVQVDELGAGSEMWESVRQKYGCLDFSMQGNSRLLNFLLNNNNSSVYLMQYLR